MSDDDYDDAPRPSKRPKLFTEFDCPECSANNPASDGFRVGDEVTCMWCALTWRVRATDDGFKLVPA
jgi:hypothetical protein